MIKILIWKIQIGTAVEAYLGKQKTFIKSKGSSKKNPERI